MKKITGFLLLLIYVSQSYSQNGLIFLNHITTKDGLPENSVQTIKQDKYGFLWFSSFAGICKYDGYEFIEYIAEPDNPEALYSRSIYNMMLDSFQNLWISFFDTSTYCMYNYETDNFTRFPRSKTPTYIIKGMDRKNINPLVAENSKLYQWSFDNGFLIQKNLMNGETKYYCIKTSDKTELLNEHIKTMFLDSKGVLWIGTENQGVYKVNTLIKPFNNYLSKSSFCNINFKETIRAIYIDKNEIWLGTYNHGVIIFNPLNNKIRWIKETSINSPNGIINNQVRAILKDRYGFFWIGTKNGLTRYDPQTEKSIHFNRYSENKIPQNWVHAIMEDHEGELWIGTFNGIARYDRKNNRFIEIDYKKILRSNHVCYIYEDSKNNLWIATQGGGLTILKRTNEKDKFISKTYIHEFNNPNSLSSNRIFSVLEDKFGNIWVATDYGINILNLKTEKFKRIGLKEGLPNEQIMGMLFDDNNSVWVSHKKGLSKIDINTFNIKNYTEEDGLQNIEFAENAFFKNKENGELYFGNSEGINSFIPDSIKDDTLVPEVILTNIYLYNEPIKPCQKIHGTIILDKVLYLTDEIRLKSKMKYFTIEFTSLDFKNIKKIKYKYKLEGFDKNWIEIPPGNRKITFSNLPPGKYIFKITASNNNYWNENIKTLKITVLPPFWKTNVAYISYVLIFIILNYLIYKFISSKARLKSQIWYEKMKARKIEQLNAMKFQFFTNISHELKTPLSLILDPLEKITKGLIKTSDINYYHTLMLRNARRISKLINQLLDFQRIESNNLSLEVTKDNLVNFVKSVFDSFVLIAVHRNIKYTFKSNVKKLIAEFDSDKIEKILYNLISNAFKYTYDNGEITLELLFNKYDKNNGIINFIVKDNGIGIPEDCIDKIFEPFYQVKLPAGLKNEGTGIGLAHTKELVEILKGKISVRSQINIGSEFKVSIPINYETYELNDEIEVVNKEDINEENIIVNNTSIRKQFNQSEKNITVLIIEDDIDTLTYLQHELSKDFNIIISKNGNEGTRIIYEEMPDIIITDIMMPGIDGIELCKQVKSDERTSHIPIIVITALSGESFQIESYTNGVDLYITKPINTEVLKIQIHNLINSRRKLFEYYSKLPLSEFKNVASNGYENNFINKVIHIIEENLEDPEFNIDKLSEKLKITRRQLSQKIKALTGQTVNEFIITIKLTKAAEMLINSNYSISEIAFKLGYTVPANFTRSFTKHFGKSPSEYISSIKK